jgi:uncharacterized protein YciI
MVIKHAEETNNCSMEGKFGVAGPNVLCRRKQKGPLVLKRANSTQKAFQWPKHGNFNAIDEKILEFVLEKHKNDLRITREII